MKKFQNEDSFEEIAYEKQCTQKCLIKQQLLS